MDHGYGRSPKPNSIPPRTTWRSSSPSRLRQNYGRQLTAPLLFSFRKQPRVVMNDRTNGRGRRQHVGSTETMAGCHDRFLSRRPVGGEMFLLTSPFTERPGAQPRAAREPLRVLDFRCARLVGCNVVLCVFLVRDDFRFAINSRTTGTSARGTSIVVLSRPASISAATSSSVCDS
jgi:hypothetical protein